MFRPPICLFFIAALMAPRGVNAELSLHSAPTVILDFTGPWSRTSLNEMRREAGDILSASGVPLDWRILGEDGPETDRDMVVMTFRGACRYQEATPGSTPGNTGAGPLGFTRMVDGEVQPFGEVNCERVAELVRRAMSGNDGARGELLFGRAMGRVVAHELVHMLTRSGRHGAEGVEKPALSGGQLISGYLPLSESDVEWLRRDLR